jgi:hypothetical protein
MAWLPVYQSLREHRKVLVLADTLDIPEAQAVGHLVLFWLWALDNSPDGSLPESPRIVAKAAQWEGECATFVDAMTSSGWLNEDGTIHDWSEFAGKLIEQRETTRERAKKHREEKRVAYANGTRSERVVQKRREEKRREEELVSAETPDPPAPIEKTVTIATLGRERYTHWCEVFPTETARLSYTQDTRRAVEARLREGISPETIDLAVTNARDDAWWNGQKDGEWKAHLKTICGKGSTVEKLATKAGQNALPDTHSAKLAQVRRIRERAGDIAAKGAAQQEGITWEEVCNVAR